MGSSDDNRLAEPAPAPAEAGSPSQWAELERRVLLLAKRLRAALDARRQLEAEASDLRAQIQAGKDEIAELQQSRESERQRKREARERINSLIRLIDDIDEGR